MKNLRTIATLFLSPRRHSSDLSFTDIGLLLDLHYTSIRMFQKENARLEGLLRLAMDRKMDIRTDKIWTHYPWRSFLQSTTTYQIAHCWPLSPNTLVRSLSPPSVGVKGVLHNPATVSNSPALFQTQKRPPRGRLIPNFLVVSRFLMQSLPYFWELRIIGLFVCFLVDRWYC